MKTLQGRLDKHANLISSVVFCIGLLIPSLPLEAQSSKASTSGQTKHPILDSSFDPLHQVSTSLQLLSKRVSPSVVQIFSTGYSPDSDREHRNTDLLSRGLTSGIFFRSYIPSTSAFPETGAGRLLHHYFRGLLSVHLRYGLHARQVAFATLCTRGFSSLVASPAALIATGSSEPVPGRVYRFRDSASH